MAETQKTSPLYVTIYHQIRDDILSGKYKEGSFLPTEEELCAMYSASRTTIRSAIGILRDEKLVSVRQGRGTEVMHIRKIVDDFTFPSYSSATQTTITNEFLTEGSSTTSAQGAIIDRIPAEFTVAHALGISPGTDVYRLQRDKFVNDTIFCYTVSYVPCSLTPDLEQHNGQILFLYDFLNRNYGIKYKSSHFSISAISAGFLEARLLNVKSGSALLHSCRTAYCESGIFEYNESFFRPDLMQFSVDMSVQLPESLE